MGRLDLTRAGRGGCSCAPFQSTGGLCSVRRGEASEKHGGHPRSQPPRRSDPNATLAKGSAASRREIFCQAGGADGWHAAHVWWSGPAASCGRALRSPPLRCMVTLRSITWIGWRVGVGPCDLANAPAPARVRRQRPQMRRGFAFFLVVFSS